MTFLDELKKTKLAAVELFRRRPRDGNATEPSMGKATLPPIKSSTPRTPVLTAVGRKDSLAVHGPTLPPFEDGRRSSLVRQSGRNLPKFLKPDNIKGGLVQEKTQQSRLSLDLSKGESGVSPLRPEDVRRIQRKIEIEAEFKERTRRSVDRTWPIHSEGREQNITGHSQNLSKTICEDLSLWSATDEARTAYRDTATRGDHQGGNRGHNERGSEQVVKLPEIKRPKFVPKMESTSRKPVPPKPQDASKAAGFVTRKPQPVSARLNHYYFKPDPSLDELLDFDDLPDYVGPKIVSRPVHHRRHDSDPRVRRPSDVRVRRNVPLATRGTETLGSHYSTNYQERLLPDQRVKLPPVYKAPVRTVPTKQCEDDPLEGLDSLLVEGEGGTTRRQTSRAAHEKYDDPLNGLDELLSNVEQIAEERNRKVSTSLRRNTPDAISKESKSLESQGTCASEDDCTSCSGSVDSCSSLWAQVERMKKMHEEKRRERKRRQRLMEFGEEEEEGEEKEEEEV